MPIEPQRDPFKPSGDSWADNPKLVENLFKAIVKHNASDVVDMLLAKHMGIENTKEAILKDICPKGNNGHDDKPDKSYHPFHDHVYDFNLSCYINTEREMIANSLIDKKEWEWPSNGKGPVKLKDMETDHIFNTIRMLVNKAVSKNLRVDGNSKMPVTGIPLHNREQEFLCAFFEIISDREDITQAHLIKLSQLAVLAKTYI